MGKAKARITRSKGHKRATVKRKQYEKSENYYIIEIPDERELKAFVKFAHLYLRLRERIVDSGVHLGFVTVNTSKRDDYPTEGQTNALSLIKEIDEEINKWLNQRI